MFTYTDEFKHIVIIKNEKEKFPREIFEEHDLDIATNTIRKLKNSSHIKLHTDAFIYSDQGAHYTSPKFQTLLKQCSLGQSMSRRGNCWDNAPQELIFGNFKDESYIRECNNIAELKTEVDAYMDYYNNYRCQWNLNKMTPIQYRNHLISST